MECSKTIQTEVYSNTILPQEISISNKKPNLTWEATRERRAKPKISRREEISKDQSRNK